MSGFHHNALKSSKPKKFTDDNSLAYLKKIARFLDFQVAVDSNPPTSFCLASHCSSAWHLTKKISETASRFLDQNQDVQLLECGQARKKFGNPKALLKAVLATSTFTWESYNSCYGTFMETKCNPFYGIKSADKLEDRLGFLERTASRFQLKNV